MEEIMNLEFGEGMISILVVVGIITLLILALRWDGSYRDELPHEHDDDQNHKEDEGSKD